MGVGGTALGFVLGSLANLLDSLVLAHLQPPQVAITVDFLFALRLFARLAPYDRDGRTRKL